MRKLMLATLLAGAVLAPPALAQTLKIGAPQPMTGPDAPFGDKFKKAYAMAVEEFNASGWELLSFHRSGAQLVGGAPVHRSSLFC